MKTLPLGFLLTILFFSCTKENDTLGLSSEEDGSLFSSSTKNVELAVYSELSDSVVSKSSEQVFIGGYNSIESGLLSHSTFTSLVPSDFNFRIPSGGISITNAELSFDVIDQYGTNVQQDFDVKILDKAVSKSGTYYTHNRFTSSETSYGSFILDETDSTTVTVELDTAIARTILEAGNASFTTAEVFVEIFKGIAIVPSSAPATNEGITFTIDPESIKITFDYQENENTDNQGSIELVDDSRSFYNSTWDENGELTQHLTDSTLGRNEVILRGLGLANVRIDFPSLQEWYDQEGVLINKAILQLTYQGPENEDLVLPSSLVFHQLNSQSSTGVQGVYSSSTRYYEFDIEPLLTENLSQGGNMSFELSIQNSGSHPEQLLLMGTESQYTPISLEIFYTNH